MLQFLMMLPANWVFFIYLTKPFFYYIWRLWRVLILDPSFNKIWEDGKVVVKIIAQSHV